MLGSLLSIFPLQLWSLFNVIFLCVMFLIKTHTFSCTLRLGFRGRLCLRHLKTLSIQLFRGSILSELVELIIQNYSQTNWKEERKYLDSICWNSRPSVLLKNSQSANPPNRANSLTLSTSSLQKMVNVQVAVGYKIIHMVHMSGEILITKRKTP